MNSQSALAIIITTGSGTSIRRRNRFRRAPVPASWPAMSRVLFPPSHDRVLYPPIQIEEEEQLPAYDEPPVYTEF